MQVWGVGGRGRQAGGGRAGACSGSWFCVLPPVEAIKPLLQEHDSGCSIGHRRVGDTYAAPATSLVGMYLGTIASCGHV